jgi:hypothetical protein
MERSAPGDSPGAKTTKERPSMPLGRRDFLAVSGSVAASALLLGRLRAAADEEKKGAGIKYGLVTYQWAKDWDLPTLLENCQTAGVLGVELRTTHKHGVEPTLDDKQRAEVRRRFADAGITCVGIGSAEEFDSPDSTKLKKAIAATKEFVRLSHDVGGSGVKVRPNNFHPEVDHQKTIEQVGEALNEVGDFAAGFGQQIRLEVHGQCAQLPTIKAIMGVADHPNVGICWNCNTTDLEPPGLEHNFNLVKDRLGETCHIHRMEQESYPHQKLIELFVGIDWNGWMMLEEGKIPENIVAELTRERELFEKMLATARAKSE